MTKRIGLSVMTTTCAKCGAAFDLHERDLYPGHSLCVPCTQDFLEEFSAEQRQRELNEAIYLRAVRKFFERAD